MYGKHIILLCLIYFTFSFFDDEKNHPYEILRKTISLWLIYLILTKMNLDITILVIFLIFVLYVYDDYEVYLESSGGDYNKEKHEENKKNLRYGIMAIALIGFVSYYLKQRKDHSKNFDHIKFILGTEKCDFK